MQNEVVLKIFGMGYVKIHGFHGTQSGFEHGGMPKKSTYISAVTYPRQLNLLSN